MNFVKPCFNLISDNVNSRSTVWYLSLFNPTITENGPLEWTWIRGAFKARSYENLYKNHFDLIFLHRKGWGTKKQTKIWDQKPPLGAKITIFVSYSKEKNYDSLQPLIIKNWMFHPNKEGVGWLSLHLLDHPKSLWKTIILLF